MSFGISKKAQKQNGSSQSTDCPDVMYDVRECNGIEYIAEEVNGVLQWVPNDHKDKVKTKIFRGFFSKRR
jgi:hypothetical protein